MPLEAGQAIIAELADATVLVVGEGLCMSKLPLVDPDNNSREDEATDIPEGSVLELEIEVSRLKAALLDVFGIVLEVDEARLRVEVVDIVEVNVREAEDELKPGLLETGGITCAPQTFVFELAEPTRLFK